MKWEDIVEIYATDKSILFWKGNRYYLLGNSIAKDNEYAKSILVSRYGDYTYKYIKRKDIGTVTITL